MVLKTFSSYLDVNRVEIIFYERRIQSYPSIPLYSSLHTHFNDQNIKKHISQKPLQGKEFKIYGDFFNNIKKNKII